MFVMAAVFHPEISPLNDNASLNMYLGVARQGRAGRCLDAALPSAAETEAAVQARSKMSEQEAAIAPSISRRSSPSWSTIPGHGGESSKERGKE